MANFSKKAEALALRKQELSYNQIKQRIGVSKGTLSGWLKDYPLSKERIATLRDHSEQRIEKFRETMRKKKEDRLRNTYDKEKINTLPLTKKEIFLFGLGIYWGEGTKRQMSELSISNTDPNLINLFIYWLEQSFNISRKKIKILLRLYGDMDIDKETIYWSKTLNIPICQFNRPYIKKNSVLNINHKGNFGHGTCNARINSVPLAEKVLMTIKAIANEYNTGA